MEATPTNKTTDTQSKRPQRKGANIRPAQIIIDNTQCCRSSQKVKEDLEAAATKAKAQKEQQAEVGAAIVTHLTAAKDKLHAKDIEYVKHTARPDLQVQPTKKMKLATGRRLQLHHR